MRDYGEKINEWMLAESIGYEQAADRLNVSSAIVRLWVKGKRQPTLKHQRTLDRVLGISSNLHSRVDGLERRIKKLEEAK